MSERPDLNALLETVDNALEASAEVRRGVDPLVSPALLQEAREGLAAWLSK